MNLDDYLDAWQVIPPDMWENSEGPENWYAVCNEVGIVAYFGDESAAFGFRLLMINLALNTAARSPIGRLCDG